MIRILHWSIDMGRSNVSVELSLLSIHLIMPHRGHLDKSFNIFAYLGCHLNSKLVINKWHMYFGGWFKSLFNDDAKWFDFYDEVKE